MIGTTCQPETVHSNSRNGVFFHFKLYTGVNGTALIFGNGKNCAVDQVFHRHLGNTNALSVANVRQFRIIVGRFCGNGKGSITCANGNLIIFVNNNGNQTFRQSADNIAKQLCRQYAFAHIGNLCIDQIGDGGLHIVTGEAQAVSGSAQNTFNSR